MSRAERFFLSGGEMVCRTVELVCSQCDRLHFHRAAGSSVRRAVLWHISRLGCNRGRCSDQKRAKCTHHHPNWLLSALWWPARLAPPQFPDFGFQSILKVNNREAPQVHLFPPFFRPWASLGQGSVRFKCILTRLDKGIEHIIARRWSVCGKTKLFLWGWMSPPCGETVELQEKVRCFGEKTKAST